MYGNKARGSVNKIPSLPPAPIKGKLGDGQGIKLALIYSYIFLRVGTVALRSGKKR